MNLLSMHKPVYKSRSQSPYLSGRKNPEFRNPTFTSSAFGINLNVPTPKSTNRIQKSSVSNSALSSKQKNGYFNVLNDSNSQSFMGNAYRKEVERFEKILENEKHNFKQYPKQEQHSKQELITQMKINDNEWNNLLSQISSIRLQEGKKYVENWNNSNREQIKQKADIRQQEMINLKNLQEQQIKQFDSKMKQDASIKRYKEKCYLQGLDIQNEYRNQQKQNKKYQELEENIKIQQQQYQELQRKKQQYIRSLTPKRM